MRKKILFTIIISVLVGALLITTSCKRTKESNPDMIPNAGFHISLSGTANPSTLYVPMTQPYVSSQISVRAVNNDGSAAAGYNVIFQVGQYGYLDGYKLSDVRTTDTNGNVSHLFFLPAGTNVKGDVMTQLYVTLVDDSRLDHSGSEIYDVIPIRILPAYQQGVLIHGDVLTPSGSGVEGVAIEMNGEDNKADGVAVTRSSGSYDLYVLAGWYGTITPTATGYSFIPQSYTFDPTTPLVADIMNLDFVAIFQSGDTLATDVTQWAVPVEGGTQQVNVYNGTGDAAINYIVLPDSPWIHVSPNSGVTPGKFTITVDENTTGTDRTGTITINATSTQGSSVTIAISQLGEEVADKARLAVDIETVNVGYEQTSVNINAYNSTTSDAIHYLITVIPENSWITVSAVSGDTPDNFIITVAQNYEEARTGQVILTPTTTGVSNTVTISVNQEAGFSLALDIQSKNVPVGGETFTVTVTNPSTSLAVPFTVTENETWITVSPAGSSTPAEISITVSANATGQLRTTRIIFTELLTTTAGQQLQVTLVITQQGT
jgi:hypothetical protein